MQPVWWKAFLGVAQLGTSLRTQLGIECPTCTFKRYATEHANITEHRDDCTWLSYLLSRDVIESFIVQTIDGAGGVSLLVSVFLQQFDGCFFFEGFKVRLWLPSVWSKVAQMGSLCRWGSLHFPERQRDFSFTKGCDDDDDDDVTRWWNTMLALQVLKCSNWKRNIYLETIWDYVIALLRIIFLFPRWNTWFPEGCSLYTTCYWQLTLSLLKVLVGRRSSLQVIDFKKYPKLTLFLGGGEHVDHHEPSQIPRLVVGKGQIFLLPGQSYLAI